MKVTNFNPKTTTISSRQHPRIVPYYLGHFFIYLGLLIVALVLGWLVIKAGRIYTAYQSINQHLSALDTLALSDSSNLNLAQLERDLQETAAAADTLSAEIAPFLPLAPYLTPVPAYGQDLQALPVLVAAGRDLSNIGATLLQALVAAREHAPQQPLLPYTVARSVAAKIELSQAQARLRQHHAAISRLDIDQLSPKTARRASQLKQHLPQAIAGLEVVQNLPALLGSGSPQTYLILTQNSDELRPSGGYINAAGHVVFEQGRIANFVMKDSYAVDRLSDAYPYPPAPLYNYMAAEYWVLRDASWSPDFPTTARTALRLYELGQGINANGVIALDQYGIAALLSALGPVNVEGEQVTGHNVIELMRQHWAPDPGQNLNGAWWLQRKSFMLSLADTLRQKIEQNPQSIHLPTLLGVLQQAAAEKHVLVYLKDAPWDHPRPAPWAGALHPTPGDYLMVADANVGFNKASALVERHLSYQITLAQNGGGQAQAILTYHHQGQQRRSGCSKELRYNPMYVQNMERCYWNYHSLIVPAGAQRLSGPNEVVAGKYLLRGQSTGGNIQESSLPADKKSWSQLFLLAPQQHLNLTYEYTLPPNTARFVNDHWEYSLYLQKQPGTLEPAVSVEITLPANARLLSSQPAPATRQGPVVGYQLNLKTDREIRLFYTLSPE